MHLNLMWNLQLNLSIQWNEYCDGVEYSRVVTRRGNFLVTWTDYPLEEAQWIPESNFTYPRKLKAQLKSDKPVEDTSRPS